MIKLTRARYMDNEDPWYQYLNPFHIATVEQCDWYIGDKKISGSQIYTITSSCYNVEEPVEKVLELIAAARRGS